MIKWAPAFIGMVQLCGQLIGSTSIAGATIYEVTALAWWIWTIAARQWGFLPINLVGTVISTYTLWSVL